MPHIFRSSFYYFDVRRHNARLLVDDIVYLRDLRRLKTVAPYDDACALSADDRHSLLKALGNDESLDICLCLLHASEVIDLGKRLVLCGLCR